MRAAVALLTSLAAAACVSSPDPDEDALERAAELAASTYSAKVKNRTLTLTGTSAASKLTVRGGPTAATLEVDVGDDGSADFTFDRSGYRVPAIMDLPMAPSYHDRSKSSTTTSSLSLSRS